MIGEIVREYEVLRDVTDSVDEDGYLVWEVVGLCNGIYDCTEGYLAARLHESGAG